MSNPTDQHPSPIKLLNSLLLALICSVLLIIHLSLRYAGNKIGDGLDVIALGLVLVGLSPMISKVLDSTKIGGVEFKFREIKLEVQQQGNQINTLSFFDRSFSRKRRF